MVADPDTSEPALWAVDTQKRYNNSPSALSINSSSSLESSFSIDAPSSQSSISSASSTYSGNGWTVDIGEPRPRDLQLHNLKENVGPCAYDREDWNRLVERAQAELPAPENRQNPRRTQRLNRVESQDGVVISQRALPPPTLVRQSERKNSFVDSLVGKLTWKNSWGDLLTGK